jgi:hypothetical protein
MYVIQRDLIQIEHVKYIVSGDVVYSSSDNFCVKTAAILQYFKKRFGIPSSLVLS